MITAFNQEKQRELMAHSLSMGDAIVFPVDEGIQVTPPLRKHALKSIAISQDDVYSIALRKG